MSLRPSSFVIVALLSAVACRDTGDPLTPNPTFDRGGAADPPLVSVDLAGAPKRLWPFASSDLETPLDPINLLFVGRADPRNVRNALLALDGNRGAPFPAVFPFTCTWSDAMGGLQAAFGEESRWAGGAIQLQCGTYAPIRFHLRLFDLGDYSVANVHFEVVIPGTADHQVLSWELAEQLVVYDLARTGLLGAAPQTTASFTPAPVHRVNPSLIYNGLPQDLRTLIGGPPIPASDVGIANDGHATVLTLAAEAPPVAPTAEQHLTIVYDQVIPKPFCSTGPTDFVLVRGPVTLDHQVDARGDYRATFQAQGDLTVVPVDISTGQPTGSPLRGAVSEWQHSRADDRGGEIKGKVKQMILPADAPGSGSLRVAIDVGPGHPGDYQRTENCK